MKSIDFPKTKEKFVNFNLHPKNKKVGDCVKRAFAFTIPGKDYRDVKIELNRLKRELGEKYFNSNKVWKEYLKRLGYKKISFPAEKGKPRMNGHRFIEQFQEGTYILRMAGHLTVAHKGTIYDTWDCRDKCVYLAYRIR